MLSVNQLRKIDPSLKEMTDREIEILREDFYTMAQIAFDFWLEQKGGSKNPVWLSPKQ